MIQTRHLFSIKLSVPSIIDLGQTPMGGRKIAKSVVANLRVSA